jgi:transcriptional regulator with XRE-family HTH domain
MIDKQSLGKVIRALRDRKAWTQSELAECAGVSLRQIQRIENGEVHPRQEMLKSLADAFDLDVEELISKVSETSLSEEKLQRIIEGFQRIDVLHVITNGHDLMSMIGGAYIGRYSHCVLNNNEDADLVGSFLQDVKDWGDLWGIVEIQDRAKAEIEFTERIYELSANGFLVFGKSKREKVNLEYDKKSYIWPCICLYITTKDDPSIVKSNEEDTIFPVVFRNSGISI